MLLILHGAQQHGVGQVDHLRYAAALGSKQNALAFRGAIDNVIGRAQILAHQFRFVFVKSALEMRGEESVLHVHSRSQAEFGYAPQDERLIGGLLGVLAKQSNPTRVERSVHVVVPAMDVQRMLGERAGAYFQHHGGTLARRVVILLNAVDDSLARSEINHALAAYGMRDGSALRCVLALGFDRDGAAAKDVKLAFRKSLLVQLATLGGRSDRVEDSRVGDASFGVIGHQLISIGCDADTGVTGFCPHYDLQAGSHLVGAVKIYLGAQLGPMATIYDSVTKQISTTVEAAQEIDCSWTS